MLQDIAIGAISKGVNHATFIALNAIVAALWLLLSLFLVYTSSTDELKHLAPHLAVMLGLCTCLGFTLNWYIANFGLRDVAVQEQEVLGISGRGNYKESLDADGSVNPQRARQPINENGDLDEETARRLKELPLTSDLDLGFATVAGFDTSGLAIQPISSTDLLTEKDKAL
jgi:hypothetical protein